MSYDPKKIHLGDVFLVRTTVRLETPPEGESAIADRLSFPPVDTESEWHMSSVGHVHVHPEDPDLVTLTVMVMVAPEEFRTYREQIEAEARAKAFEQASEEGLL